MEPSNEAIEAAERIYYEGFKTDDQKLSRMLKAAYSIDFSGMKEMYDKGFNDGAMATQTHLEGLRVFQLEQRLAERETEIERLKNEKFYWNCQTHGKSQNAWGCPDCVRELREDLGEADGLLKRFDATWSLHQETAHKDTEAYFTRRKKAAASSPPNSTFT